MTSLKLAVSKEACSKRVKKVIGMPTKHHPHRGSMQFWPRARSSKHCARVKSWNKSKDNKQGAKKEEITEELISERVSDLVKKYQIETMWVGGMRGRTLSNSFVIVDEAQNMSASTMQLILSRIDNTCKIVVVGSNRQLDNQYITKYTNGLTGLLHSTKETHDEVNLFAINLHKVLRGPITAFAEKIFSKE